MQSLHSLIRDAQDNYVSGKTTIGKYVEWSMHDTIETIDAYLNSKHTSGSQDSLGREKPFFNIITAAVNIWYRATDIDRKNIRILPDKAGNTAAAFIGTVLLQDWMKKARFGTFLNSWGITLARYGSAVVKFVEKEGELSASVIPWNRMIVDPVDFEALPRIEKFYKTPAQLRRMKNYDQDAIDSLVKAQTTRKTQDGQNKDNQSDFIELYEVHGQLDSRLLKDEPKDIDEKDIDYVQQMHVISFVKGQDGEYEDFTLYKGREAKDPYMLTHLIEVDGRTLSIGAGEYLIDPQWMLNHSMKNMKDTLDIASKIGFQTSDANYTQRNVLTSFESGDVFVHKPNEPLTQINNGKSDIVALQNFAVAWQNLAGEITSTPDALRGTTLPSGTPYSLGAYLGGQAGGLFEQMIENKGNHLEDMMREFILPFLKKQMDSKEEVVAILEDHEIAEIDAMFVPKQAVKQFNERTLETILQGGIPSPFAQQEEEQSVRKSLAPLGNKRFFKPDELGEKSWKESLKDFEMKAVVEITNENTDKQAVLTTLSTVLQSIAGNPAILQDPNARMIFNAILKETAVISPIQFSTAQTSVAPPVGVVGGNTEALSELGKENGTV